MTGPGGSNGAGGAGERVEPPRMGALLAAPPTATGRLWLTNARLFDGTGAPVREGAAVLVEDGVVAAVGSAGDGVPEGARVIDLGGRTLLPGLIDAHAHVYPHVPEPAPGAEPMWPGTGAHFLAADLREALRMGITTIRDVGSYYDIVFEVRQAIRYGAMRGPRLLTCGRIISATAPGGRWFTGMYREADGADDVRRAVREQIRRGADFVKVMTTGARSVELEDPNPAQMTREEIATIVDEAHRMGYRVAAHAEGLEGTEIAIETGIDTIEHGMYLNQRPDLLERMAASGQFLVPTLGCFYGVAGDAAPGAGPDGLERVGSDRPPTWSGMLVDLALYNLEQADLTLRAANAAGVPIATGHDWAPDPRPRHRDRPDGPPRPDAFGGAGRLDRHRGGGVGDRRSGRDDRAGSSRGSRRRGRRSVGACRGPAGPGRDLAGGAVRGAGGGRALERDPVGGARVAVDAPV